MGYIAVGLLALLALGLLWLLKVRGPVLTLAGAAIAFGCAGYAVQGSPAVGSAPRAAAERAPPLPLAGARHAMMGQFDYSDTWLNIADALASRGNTEDAARLLQAQVARHPRDYKLWVGLGNALTDHARTITPASRLAYSRAAELAPGYRPPVEPVTWPLWAAPIAAIAFGCAGYAVQGSPAVGSAPRAAAERAPPLPLAGARHAMMGQFDYSDTWLNIADALASRGNTEDAARLLQAQVARHPRDYKLWVGLGNALTDHARTITPASRLAYSRAAELAPGYPAPKFFLGLAEARSGNPEEAVRLWREILASAPPDASWRPMIEEGLRLMTQGATVSPPPAPDQAGS